MKDLCIVSSWLRRQPQAIASVPMLHLEAVTLTICEPLNSLKPMLNGFVFEACLERFVAIWRASFDCQRALSEISSVTSVCARCSPPPLNRIASGRSAPPPDRPHPTPRGAGPSGFRGREFIL